MSYKQQIVRDCDRCPATKRRAAIETVKFSYDGNDFEIDVCAAHAEMLDRDMRGWTRLAREIESPFTGRTFSLSEVEKDQLRRPSRTALRKPRTITLPDVEPEITPYDEGLDFDVWPTEAATAAMEAAGISWPKVVDAVRHHIAVVPSDRDDVSCYIARDMKILLSADHHVLGVTPRDPGEALPNQTQQPAKKIVRKGKRGGIGNIGPRDYNDIIKAVKDADGWTLEQGGKHYKITGPQGQTATMPITPSDWRSSLNVVAQLRAIGLDLKEPTRTTRTA